MQGQKIVAGITGGIAAYKSAELVRRLREKGASVRVVMTAAAKQFITPLTLQALSGYPVHDELWDTQAEAAMGHIALARWAHKVVVAPASADFLARLATGQANDLLTTLCLATAAPLYVAPAMNRQMWQHPATQENIQRLQARGVKMIGPADGSQACGEIGLGRMSDVPVILAALQAPERMGVLAGVKVLITAGPTREPLDPVRYLSNHSSGKMGYALAEAARQAGAQVTLVSGPSSLPVPAGIEMIAVETADEMLAAVMQHIADQHIFIAAAAVSDYRPEQSAAQKITRQAGHWQIHLLRNADILQEVTRLPQPPFTVGFAAETHEVLAHAREKLQRKKCDLLIANQVGQAEGGFNSDNNAVTLLWAHGERQWPLMAKTLLAQELIPVIAEHYHAKYSDKNP